MVGTAHKVIKVEPYKIGKSFVKIPKNDTKTLLEIHNRMFNLINNKFFSLLFFRG